MNHPAATSRRARTGAQKAARRAAILEAAAQHFVETGFEAFSMGQLGRMAGVAKGTLYLYFSSREEVLLALYLEKLAAWQQRIVAAAGATATDDHFARIFYTTAYEDQALLPLMSRLDSVIEHNVTLETLIAAKRDMADQVDQLGRALSAPLGLTPGQVHDALASLASLLLGAAQVDAGPRIDRRRLPADVKRLMASFASETVFLTNACRILRGIRAGR
jgi:AcrR family transcriptional regulator